jgi:hypothetical protein
LYCACFAIHVNHGKKVFHEGNSKRVSYCVKCCIQTLHPVHISFCCLNTVILIFVLYRTEDYKYQ